MLHNTTENTFKADVLDSAIPVLVDFWAEWCQPCKGMVSVLEAVADKYEGKVKIIKLNLDDAPEVGMAYGIRSLPTLVLFQNGKAVNKLAGAAPQSKVEDLLG